MLRYPWCERFNVKSTNKHIQFTNGKKTAYEFVASTNIVVTTWYIQQLLYEPGRLIGLGRLLQELETGRKKCDISVGIYARKPRIEVSLDNT